MREKGNDMAKKRNSKAKLNPTIATIGILVLLLLGSLGVQVPEIIQDYFGVDGPKTTQQTPQNKPNQTAEPELGENPGIIDHGLATFTKEELIDSSTGWVTYHKLDSLERATGGDALIKKKMINTGTKANRDVKPPGFISGLEPYGHSRGHLIGRQFGGSGDSLQNLVTIYQDPVNSPLMTEYENMIRVAVDNGETVRYRVIPIYDDAKDLKPTEIHMQGQSVSDKGSINFNISILNLR